MRQTIGIVLFQDAEELDFAGPWEVFAYLRQAEPLMCEAFLVTQNADVIRFSRAALPERAFARGD
jgi:hypothetical protein